MKQQAFRAGHGHSVWKAFEALPPLSQAAQHLSSSVASAQRLFTLVDIVPSVCNPAGPLPVPLHADIKVRDLRFAYPSTKDHESRADQSAVVSGVQSLVLDWVRFSLPTGQRIAVVGPSGAGKSTLIQLLLRFWEYEQGQIWLGGHELRRYRAENVRQLISEVAQDTHLFSRDAPLVPAQHPFA